MIDIRAFVNNKPELGPDLNAGAGGKYIYCELTKISASQLQLSKRTMRWSMNNNSPYLWCSSSNALLDIHCGKWYSSIADICSSNVKNALGYPWGCDCTDMNEGAGGAYLICAYTHAIPVGVTSSVSGRNESDYYGVNAQDIAAGRGAAVVRDVCIIVGTSQSITAPACYYKINQDLNEGAGGRWIFMCYKKEYVAYKNQQIIDKDI